MDSYLKNIGHSVFIKLYGIFRDVYKYNVDVHNSCISTYVYELFIKCISFYMHM